MGEPLAADVVGSTAHASGSACCKCNSVGQVWNPAAHAGAQLAPSHWRESLAVAVGLAGGAPHAARRPLQHTLLKHGGL